MRACIILCLALAVGSVSANPLQSTPGFIVLAEHRFDPAVQQLMAERSLKALPLRDGQLYYLYPTSYSRAHLEEAQIRYLEHLLDKTEAEAEAELDEPESD